MRPASFCIEMLGQSARIASVDPMVLRTLAAVLDDLCVPDTCVADTELVVRTTDGDGAFAVDINGQEQWTASSIASVVQECVMRLNQIAVAGCTSLALHAGGVQVGGPGSGGGLVLPAKSESGKSTLTAGLVRAGYAYLSDEAIALDWDTHVIQPYPKPMSLDPGAFALFPEWAPSFAEAHDAASDAQWHVPAGGVGSVGAACEVRFVVFPEYSPEADTRLEPMSRGTALLEMCKNTFRFNTQGRRCLDHLADVVRDAECYRLPMSDLDAAVRVVTELVGGP